MIGSINTSDHYPIFCSISHQNVKTLYDKAYKKLKAKPLLKKSKILPDLVNPFTRE
jgi:hypothetical protein